MNKLILEKDFRVSVHDCSPKGMRTYAILRHIQDMADQHGALLGISVKDMVARGFYWVIVNVKLKLIEPMPFETPIRIRTWPVGNERHLSSRFYEGYNLDNGRQVFAAATDFMLLSLKTKRPVNMQELDFCIPDAGLECAAGKPCRQCRLPNYELIDSVNVRYSSIDVNGHVNNTEYVRWGMDALHSRKEYLRRANQIDVSFVSEVYENECLQILYAPSGEHQVALLGRSSADNRNVFLMQVTFDEDDKWERAYFLNQSQAPKAGLCP